MSNSSFADKFIGRVLVGPVVGLLRGMLGVLSIDAAVNGALFVATTMLLPAGATIPMILGTFLAVSFGYSFLKSFIQAPITTLKTIGNTILNTLLAIGSFISFASKNPLAAIGGVLLATASLAAIASFAGVVVLLLTLPAAHLIGMASGSLVMAFGLGYAYSIASDLAVDSFNILVAGVKTLFGVKNTKEVSYTKGPITAGFHAGLAAADVAGADYGTGYERAGPKELVTAAYRSFADNKITFDTDGEVVRADAVVKPNLEMF